MESNHRPPPYQGGALPTELREQLFQPFKQQTLGKSLRGTRSMERETGIEPAQSAWKAEVLPLNYSRAGTTCLGNAPTGGNSIGSCLIAAAPLSRRVFLSSWWREVDSNHRRREPADLQSAPVGRLGISPCTEPRIFLSRGIHCQGLDAAKSCARCTGVARRRFRPWAATGIGRLRPPSPWTVQAGVVRSQPACGPRR
jgi:hypothetical protein